MKDPAVLELDLQPAAARQRGTLRVGESVEVVVAAGREWNHTGLLLESGGVYELEVKGGQVWHDAQISSGAEGFVWKDLGQWRERLIALVFAPFRRQPAQKWFALIGSIGENEARAFLIGRRCQCRPLLGGELCCYANDVKGHYANNRGHLALTVTRTG